MRKEWDSIHQEILEYLNKDEFEFKFTEEPLHSQLIAEKAIDSGFSHLISVGGDGLANEICNFLARTNNTDTVFGMIPAGTSNDSHQTHNFPKDPAKTLPLLLENNIEKFAMGEVKGDFSEEPYYFIDHCDTGLAALAAKSAKYGSRLFKGEWKYTYYALKNLTRFKLNSGRVTIDGEVYEEDFAVIAASFGTHMSGYHLWPNNTNRSGDFGILLAFNHSRLGLLKLMLAAEKGKHLDRDGVEYVRGNTIEIELTNPWPYQAEGEIFTEESKSIEIRHLPNKIKVVTNIE